MGLVIFLIDISAPLDIADNTELKNWLRAPARYLAITGLVLLHK
jgi:hypothetical protein